MNYFVELKEGLSIAWDAIRANKLRSVLTTLGIVIGIISVTLMGTVINGINTAFQNGISGMGADVLYVDRTDWLIDSWAEWTKEQKRAYINKDEVRFIQREMPMASDVAPSVGNNQSISYKRKDSSSVRVVGTTDEFMDIHAIYHGGGAFYERGGGGGGTAGMCARNERGRAAVWNESPLGKSVRLGGRAMEVIGVIERQGQFAGISSLGRRGHHSAAADAERLLAGARIMKFW